MHKELCSLQIQKAKPLHSSVPSGFPRPLPHTAVRMESSLLVAASWGPVAVQQGGTRLQRF